MASLLNDPKLERLLDRLHCQSDAQIDETDAYYERRERDGTIDPENYCDDDMHRFLANKLVALDRDKAEFCYQLCRALRATRVVEAGTSHGVSTLYLAAAVRDNQVENGVVIGTEHEASIAEIARENFEAAGLSEFIDLCLFKRFTGYPCPTCGTTRGIISLLHGKYIEGWYYNPLVFSIGIIVIIDLVFRFIFGRTIKISLKRNDRKLVWIFFIAIFLINWAYIIFYVG